MFEISNYDLERPLPTRGNEKVIRLMKDGLGRIIMSLPHRDQK